MVSSPSTTLRGFGDASPGAALLTNLPHLMGLLPVAVYTCESTGGTITYFNNHAATLWGRAPKLGDTEFSFCGSFKLFRADGSVLPHEQTPMAMAMREGCSYRNQEVIIERPDRTRVAVLVNIEPIRNEEGRVIGAVNVFHESLPSHQAEEARAYLAAIIENSDDAIISKDLNGIIQTWNKGAERMFGYTADEAVGEPVLMLIPADRQNEESQILERLKRGERVDHFETIRVAKDGSQLNISLTISPIMDSHGRVIGASKIARDITERKRTQQALRELECKYLEALEEKVRQTSSELLQSQERLRHSERMAALGTLSAGLGHDMGNVLMPLSAHLETVVSLVANENGKPQSQTTAIGDARMSEHIQSIRKSIEYLRSLAGGLRMLATDPLRQHSVPAKIQLVEWWYQAEPLLKTALGRRFELEHDIPSDLPPLAIHSHLLTQAVFNLVQNAGQALAGPPLKFDGKVGVSAMLDGGAVLIIVRDNGPGMTRDVKQRCIEPYFTTKTRGISTGMGLALVHGIVQSVGGQLMVESEPGAGATFTLTLPIEVDEERARCAPLIALKDLRLKALVDHLLRSMRMNAAPNIEQADALITDNRADAEQFLAARPGALVLTFDNVGGGAMKDSSRVLHLPATAKLGEIRSALRQLADAGGIHCN